MYYYKFNIADWHLATSHLSLEEEAIYFRLINYYYDTEKPIPEETQSVIRRLRLGSNSDIVGIVLQEFFTLESDGWHHKRCDDEISQYHDKAEINQVNGKKGGRPKKTQSVSKDNPDITLTKNHKPLTNNHNVIRVKKTPKIGLPEDFCISESIKAWATKNGHTNLDKHFEYFVDAAKSNGYVYADWDAAFRKAVASNWAKVGQGVKTQDKPTIQWHQTLGGVMAKGKELGIEPKAGETEGQYRQRLIMAGA